MFFLDYATTVILEYSLTWGVEPKTSDATEALVTTRLQALSLLMDEVYGPKNVYSEFIDVNDTNCKFINQNCTFRVYGLMFSKFICT